MFLEIQWTVTVFSEIHILHKTFNFCHDFKCCFTGKSSFWKSCLPGIIVWSGLKLQYFPVNKNPTCIYLFIDVGLYYESLIGPLILRQPHDNICKYYVNTCFKL
uniref:Uncharacterized protein n=1 Tax=Corethron hystrix TaxID=216773 RepID=A0A7S1B4R3_9STRA|mmetsp:Transcript_12774/g.28188  ORF Transcript_12774/g.28188 Transcript_12774/m.28188 type:complete len:104 (+) Transcript_12774:665-976(+)